MRSLEAPVDWVGLAISVDSVVEIFLFFRFVAIAWTTFVFLKCGDEFQDKTRSCS